MVWPNLRIWLVAANISLALQSIFCGERTQDSEGSTTMDIERNAAVSSCDVTRGNLCFSFHGLNQTMVNVIHCWCLRASQ